MLGCGDSREKSGIEGPVCDAFKEPEGGFACLDMVQLDAVHAVLPTPLKMNESRRCHNSFRHGRRKRRSVSGGSGNPREKLVAQLLPQRR